MMSPLHQMSNQHHCNKSCNGMVTSIGNVSLLFVSYQSSVTHGSYKACKLWRLIKFIGMQTSPLTSPLPINGVFAWDRLYQPCQAYVERIEDLIKKSTPNQLHSERKKDESNCGLARLRDTSPLVIDLNSYYVISRLVYKGKLLPM